MARPLKQGLDYFPLDTVIDTNLKLVKAEYGVVGYGTIILIYQQIYRENGYYCEWNQDVELLFSQENNVGRNFVSEVVKRCIERGIFDKSMYADHAILTSGGVQNIYIAATRQRSSNGTIKRYSLLNEHINIVNNNDKPVNSGNNSINHGGNATKESKLNKSKVNKDIDQLFKVFWDMYPKKTDKKKSFIVFKKVCVNEQIYKEIIDGLIVYNRTKKVAEGFEKNPTTWLNGECWNDEYKSSELVKSKGSKKPEYSNMADNNDLEGWANNETN